MYHTLDICEQVAEKLSSPEKISDAMPNFPEQSLANGWIGLALFYAVLDNFFPNKGYERIAHDYLCLSSSPLQIPISILEGLTGYCFSAYFCSKNGFRYHRLLSTLDNLLIEKLDYLFQMHHQMDFIPNYYYLAQGLSGVIAYLSLRKDHSVLRRNAQKCVEIIIQQMSRKKMIAGYEVPGWYESSEDLLTGEENLYPNGKFSLSMLSGISGVLSALSIAGNEGIHADGLEEIIRSIAEWLKNKKRDLSQGCQWPSIISFEEEVGYPTANINNTPYQWIITLSIARSLYLAGKFLSSDSLKQFAENIYVEFFHSSFQETLPKNPSFAFGNAGILALTSSMAIDTESYFLTKQVDVLEINLKTTFSPLHPFGFQLRMKKDEQYYNVNEPGIISGSAGITLSLLLAQGKSDLKWDRLLFMR